MTRAPIATVLVLVAALVPATGAGAQGTAEDAPKPSPALVDDAVQRGDLGEATGALYLAYAATRDPRLPERFASDEPFAPTLPLLRAERAAAALPDGPTRTRLREVLATPRRAPGDTTTGAFATRCSVLSLDPKPQRYESEFFLLDFDPAEMLASPISIEEYGDVLDAAWRKEVDDFGYAAPPLDTTPEPPNAPITKYHVRVDAALGPAIFGFVSSTGTYAGPVPGGDNPRTPGLEEEDAQASCMSLNANFQFFADPTDDVPDAEQAQAALEATVAHEFQHSIQFAYGGLTGDDDPDLNFSEGMATWMEDEVFDGANDNARYLYPEFTESMGEHQGDEYAYWFVWRGLVERFGTNDPGESEDVFQRFWEDDARGGEGSLNAVRAGLALKGISLEDAYHDFAVAAKLVRPCDGIVSLPFCFEEAALYRENAGVPESQGAIDTVGGSFGEEDAATVEDNFALNWIDLPASAGAYDVTLENSSTRPSGQLRLSAACDLGAGGLRRVPAGVADGGESVTARIDSSGCAGRPVAVITNQTQTASDPEADTERSYVLRTAAGSSSGADGTRSGSGAGSGSGSGSEPAPAPVTPAPAAVSGGVAGQAAQTARACSQPTAFVRVGATRSERGARLSFTRRPGAGRVDVDVFQHASGRQVVGERLVARFRGRSRSFTWNGRATRRGRTVTDGVYSVRFRSRVAGGARSTDIRRAALRRSGGRFAATRAFDRPRTCTALRTFKLLRPVFGGRSNRSNEVTFTLAARATVRLEVRRGSRILERRALGSRAAGVQHRIRVDAERLGRGDLEFRLVVQGAAGRPLTERLFARRA